ncbi:SNF2 family N-terminal domain-containing protein [Triangularia verruculosa]|uniref:SNF2 family N-terminal domain-containing protein n=1 Tax=Triangularia verruculosa TaxID=2587418 RepID=A0AAN6XE40_9PEZI|nr:SNF2 family N-terminal domain-containing protein [Triangularia verruculosa]
MELISTLKYRASGSSPAPSQSEASSSASVDSFRTSLINATEGSVESTPLSGGLPASESALATSFQEAECRLSPNTEIVLTGRQSFKLNVEPDVCFGVILSTAFSSVSCEATDNLDVSLFGSALKLTLTTTGKYVGLVKCQGLVKALSKFSVTLKARMIKLGASDRKDKRGTAMPWSPTDTPLRITVCGLKIESEDLGNMLSDHSLFFQHPFPTEVDPSLLYYNPHYLLRPGTTMPDVAQLTLSGPDEPQVIERLDDVSKARVMRIFDLTYDPSASIEVKPSPRLKATLKKHQLVALSMMTEKEAAIIDQAKFPCLWERSTKPDGTACYRHRITGRRDDLPQPHRGGILADEMGLGKTLSVLALICSSLDQEDEPAADNRVEKPNARNPTLIITPKSSDKTVRGYLRIRVLKLHLLNHKYLSRHIRPRQVKTAVFHGSSRAKGFDKMLDCDILFTTYETVRSDSRSQRLLSSRSWRRVVLDEAHRIRNRAAQIFTAVSELQAPYKWALTGTPIMNSLDDFASLISFIDVQPFNTKSTFDFWITSPLKDKRSLQMKNLEHLVKATCLRRIKSQIEGDVKLPARTEKIETVELSPHDRELYDYFKSKTVKTAAGVADETTPWSYSSTAKDGGKGKNILGLLNILRLVCGHGESLLPTSALEMWKGRHDETTYWHIMQTWSKRCDQCREDIDIVDECSNPENAGELNADNDNIQSCPICGKGAQAVESKRRRKGPNGNVPATQKPAPPPSNKVQALLKNLHHEQGVSCLPQPNRTMDIKKSVVFSCWVRMLNLVQQHIEDAGFGVARIDGGTSLVDRSKAMSRFRDDPSCTVMLATIGSAAEGVDLTAANNVHLLEPHWNPMVEAQAVDRVHRIGQTRPVTTIRYITDKSVDMYVQAVQQEKLQLIDQSFLGITNETHTADQRQSQKVR